VITVVPENYHLALPVERDPVRAVDVRLVDTATGTLDTVCVEPRVAGVIGETLDAFGDWSGLLRGFLVQPFLERLRNAELGDGRLLVVR
jgi:hypothetical protein